MKVIVQRSGGFAGAILQGEEDGSALSPEQRQALQNLVAEGDPNAAQDQQADRFVYRIEVQDESGTRSMIIPEARMPPSLAAIATR